MAEKGAPIARAADVLRRLADVDDEMRRQLPVVNMSPRHGDRKDGIVGRFGLRDPEGNWLLEVGCRRTPGGGLVIAQITIEPDTGSMDVGVTAKTLRKIPVGRILDAIKVLVETRLLQEQGTRLLLGEEPAEVRYDPFPVGALAPRRGGRPPLSDELLREVALAYLEAAKEGNAINETLARKFNRPNETIRTWVRKSRRAGWLGEARQGASTMTLGPRLVEALAETQQTKRTTKRKGV